MTPSSRPNPCPLSLGTGLCCTRVGRMGSATPPWSRAASDPMSSIYRPPVPSSHRGGRDLQCVPSHRHRRERKLGFLYFHDGAFLDGHVPNSTLIRASARPGVGLALEVATLRRRTTVLRPTFAEKTVHLEILHLTEHPQLSRVS